MFSVCLPHLTVKFQGWIKHDWFQRYNWIILTLFPILKALLSAVLESFSSRLSLLQHQRWSLAALQSREKKSHLCYGLSISEERALILTATCPSLDQALCPDTQALWLASWYCQPISVTQESRPLLHQEEREHEGSVVRSCWEIAIV